jgi:rhodanese-related sulfurtransferase
MVWNHSFLPVLQQQAQYLLPLFRLHKEYPASILRSSNCSALQQAQHASISTRCLQAAVGSNWALFSQGRTLSSSSQQQQEQQLLYLLPMPSLSHAMQSGRVNKWLKSPGDLVSIYDIIAEVTTDNLVEEAYKIDDFAGSVTLLLESQEEAYLAAVLVAEGQELQIGAPIAVLCENENDVSAAADAAKQLEGLNVYDEAAMQQQNHRGLSLQLLEWQSYLKESSKDGSSSCGCM